MKKFFAVFMAVFCLFFAIPSVSAAEATTSASYDDYETYRLLAEFEEKHPYRFAGSKGTVDAEVWLEQKLIEFGYTANELTKQSFLFYEEEERTGVNLIAKHAYDPNKKDVILGAHYDNAAKTGSLGALDNGSGVATVLNVAKQSVGRDYPFNLVVVFFDGEEPGLRGSAFYASKMTQSERDNTLVMINVDTVACGEYLYVYGQDKATNYETFLANASNGVSTGFVKTSPLNKRATALLYGYGYPETSFYHNGQASDHSSFKAQGIPTAFFFSGNWQSGYAGYVESDRAEHILHTSKDSVESLKRLYGIEFVNKMETVSQTLLNAFTSADFLPVMTNARSEMIPRFWYSTVWSGAILGVLLVAALIFVVLYYKKLVKNSYLGTPEVKQSNVFRAPDADDIFSFRK